MRIFCPFGSPIWILPRQRHCSTPCTQRIDHGFFGYANGTPTPARIHLWRLDTLYSWHITPEQIVFLPGLVCGLNLVARASDERGSGILVNTPIYPPFLSAPTNQERVVHEAPLAMTQAMTTWAQLSPL